ncbi:MAG: hypothetical protein J6X43_00250 [Bacteroidales bacterium]|nr:hypothetical protein [Bacteroidales bacterium]
MKEINELEEIEVFDKYLDNELSESERKEFENRLTSDEDFNKQFLVHSMLVSGIRKYCFKKEIKDYELKQQAQRRQFFSYAAAACITAFVACSGGGYYQNYSVLNSQPLVQTVSFTSSAEGVLPEISSEKNMDVDDPQALQKLVDKLQKQNSVTPQEGLQDEIDWMQAMIYAKEHKIFKARKMLKKISKSDSKYQKNAQDLLDELWF